MRPTSIPSNHPSLVPSHTDWKVPVVNVGAEFRQPFDAAPVGSTADEVVDITITEAKQLYGFDDEGAALYKYYISQFNSDAVPPADVSEASDNDKDDDGVTTGGISAKAPEGKHSGAASTTNCEAPPQKRKLRDFEDVDAFSVDYPAPEELVTYCHIEMTREDLKMFRRFEQEFIDRCNKIDIDDDNEDDDDDDGGE